MEKNVLLWTRKKDVSQVVELLKDNKLVVGTSDTVLGLLAPLTQQGFEQLNTIKGRSEKPYIVLLGDYQKMTNFVQGPINKPVQSLVDHCWPGPLTLIMKAKNDLSRFLQTKDNTIALRVPNHQGLLAVLDHFDGLFSTSANKTSEPIPNVVSEINQEIIKGSSALVLNEPGQEVIATIKPSTILDCSGQDIRVIREGAYLISELEKVALQSFKRV